MSGLLCGEGQILLSTLIFVLLQMMMILITTKSLFFPSLASTFQKTLFGVWLVIWSWYNDCFTNQKHGNYLLWDLITQYPNDLVFFVISFSILISIGLGFWSLRLFRLHRDAVGKYATERAVTKIGSTIFLQFWLQWCNWPLSNSHILISLFNPWQVCYVFVYIWSY